MMTTWHEYKKRRPLTGIARQAYDVERHRMGAGYLILKARAGAGLTQQELADRMGTSQPMVARWEAGTQIPSVRTLMRIAEATGYRLVMDLRRRTDSPPTRRRAAGA